MCSLFGEVYGFLPPAKLTRKAFLKIILVPLQYMLHPKGHPWEIVVFHGIIFTLRLEMSRSFHFCLFYISPFDK